MSRHRHGHRHFNKFLVNLGKCAASGCQVPLDSRERSHVSDDEHQAVKVASRAPLTHARIGRIPRPFGVRSIALTGLLILAGFYAVYLIADPAADRIGGLALFLCDHID
jgi:hypothetical protein